MIRLKLLVYGLLLQTGNDALINEYHAIQGMHDLSEGVIQTSAYRYNKY